MTLIGRRNVLKGLLVGVPAAAAIGLAATAAKSAPFSLGLADAAEPESLVEKTVLFVEPHRRRWVIAPGGRRWVCWWRWGRRVCGWRSAQDPAQNPGR